MRTAEQLRRLTPDELLQVLGAQINVGLAIIAAGGLTRDKKLPQENRKGDPLLRIGDFTVFAREEKP